MRGSSVTTENIQLLQKSPEKIRNICILAHVDHGKTTLADSLVASNGIISPRMAGKLRYLDSREDEQMRGITMKSSSISLLYSNDNKNYLINLIDSPGHVDFSSEVSTAVRLSDGAIIVVDAVEGVCPQTHAVLRQAWLENIHPVLFLNKIDRLITEVKMEPLRAYIHLQQILEQVNVFTSELFTSEILQKTSEQTPTFPQTEGMQHLNLDDKVYDWSSGIEETDDSNIYFSPDRGNVIFGSALDGWGFSISHFAELYGSKLGINADLLRKTLWGDFFLNTKTKRIHKGAQSKAKKPLFVQFVLDNLWSVYDAVYVRRDKTKIEKIIASLNLTISARDLRHNDARVQLQAVCSQWLPLATAVLGMVVDQLPAPIGMSDDRVERLMCNRVQQFESLPPETRQLKQAFLNSSSSDENPVIVYISKMFPVDKKHLPQNRQRPLTEEEIKQRREQARQRHLLAFEKHKSEMNGLDSGHFDQLDPQRGVPLTIVEEPVGDDNTNDNEDDHVFLAFARVFSGTLRKGQTLYVLAPKHDPAEALLKIRTCDQNGVLSGDDELPAHVKRVTVNQLYLFMGRELEAIDTAPAGNIIGIAGLEDHVLKSATLSSTLACPAFTPVYAMTMAIVRVALEPKHAGDMSQLVHGLKLLNQADPCVEVLVQETGEHVIITAGEVHLERCIDDLQQRYAKVQINMSEPIVPLRETIIVPPKVDMANEAIHDLNQPIKLQQKSLVNDGLDTHQSSDDDDGDSDEEQIIHEPGLVEIKTANRKCTLRIRALPLPEPVTNLLEDQAFLFKTLDQYSRLRMSAKGASMSTPDAQMNTETRQAILDFRSKLKEAFSSAGKDWAGLEENIWSFGPRRNGPNILLNRVDNYCRPSIWCDVETDVGASEKSSEASSSVRDFDNAIISGFQLATLSGPLCEEPMHGVCFALEKWEYEVSFAARVSRLSLSEAETGSDEDCNDSDDDEDTRKSEGRTCNDTVTVEDRTKSDCNTSLHVAENQTHSVPIDDNRKDTRSTQIPVDLNAGQNTSSREILNSSSPYVENITDNSNTDNDLIVVGAFKEKCISDDSIVHSAKNTSVSWKEEVHSVCHASVTSSTVKPSMSRPSSSQGDVFGPFSGQLISCMKDGCRRAFQRQPQRLMVAMYKCDIQATADVLGKLYAVLSKRNGHVLYGDMQEGSQTFTVQATLPVIDSFGFADDLRKKTSGLASPQLTFSHWEVIDVDPFWVPTTEEEYLHFGEKADSQNRARTLMNNVRRRKGLKVSEKLVEHAEKQRTLKKKK